MNRVTAADCLEVDSGFEMCAALSGRDGRTAVVEVRYDNTCDKSELQVEVSSILITSQANVSEKTK